MTLELELAFLVGLLTGIALPFWCKWWANLGHRAAEWQNQMDIKNEKI